MAGKGRIRNTYVEDLKLLRLQQLLWFIPLLLLIEMPAANGMYDPHLGRFCARDPIQYGDGPNMYCYTADMPLLGSDPSGLQLLIPRVAPNVTPKPNVFPRIYVPEPRPFVPTPPLPPPIPMPHGGPSSGPTSPPDPDPITDPDAVDLPPPGKCTQIHYDELQDAVHNACKGKNAPQACGFWGWSCDNFSEHEKRWNNCAKARRQIMNECFGGGNKIHRKVAKEAEEQAKKCSDKFYYWCFDPPKCDWQPLYAMN